MIIGEETEQIEFKLTTGEKKEAMDAICAILNKHCKGTLYFGVKDDGYITGQQVSDSTRKDISRWIYESIYPRITPSIEVLSYEEKKIIKVSFYGHNRPYSSNGNYLIRIGTENKKMTTEELRRLIKHEDYSSNWENESSNKSFDDIDDNTLLDFYNSSKECGRFSLNKYDKIKILNSLDLMIDDELKNAAWALFGNDVKIGLKLATYTTDNKVTFTDLKLINGNIYNLVNSALDYVLNRINWRVQIGSKTREQMPEIPERALREVIVNAFAHADYENTPEIEIGIHPGKIEIYNPGTFPDDLTPFDFIERNLSSFRRNKIILDILFRSKHVEKQGTGFQRVNELCNEYGVGWTYRKEAYGFFFEFIRTNVHLNVHIKESLTDSEQIVFNIIRDNERITKSEIAIRIGKSEKSVQRIVSSLIEKSLIQRVGSNKTGYWEVLK